MADLYRDAYHYSKPVITKGLWFVHDPDGDDGAGWLIDAREARDSDDAAAAVAEERYHNCDYPRVQDLVVERFDGKKWKVRVEAEDAVQFNARVVEG